MGVNGLAKFSVRSYSNYSLIQRASQSAVAKNFGDKAKQGNLNPIHLSMMRRNLMGSSQFIRNQSLFNQGLSLRCFGGKCTFSANLIC